MRNGQYEVDLVTLEMQPVASSSSRRRQDENDDGDDDEDDEANLQANTCRVRRCLWFYLKDKRSFEAFDDELNDFLEVTLLLFFLLHL